MVLALILSDHVLILHLRDKLNISLHSQQNSLLLFLKDITEDITKDITRNVSDVKDRGKMALGLKSWMDCSQDLNNCVRAFRNAHTYFVLLIAKLIQQILGD